MSSWRAGRSNDHRLETASRPPIQMFPSKRICLEEECATVLSIYNGSVSCSLHEPLGRWFVKRAV